MSYKSRTIPIIVLILSMGLFSFNTTNFLKDNFEVNIKHLVQYTTVKNAEMDICDTTRVEINLVEVTSNNKTICDKVNNEIIRSITSDEFPTLDAVLHSNDKYNEYATTKVIQMKSLLLDGNIFSVWIQQGESDCGLTNPNPYTQVLNFDLKTGNLINLQDIVQTDKIKDFENIVGQEFITKYKTEDFDIKKSTYFNMNNKFGISKKGITFYFDLYEIGPRSSGEAHILIPYSKFKNLIVPGSIITQY